MVFIVTWAHDMGILLACSAFLKLYNKGTIPTGNAAAALNKYDDYIQQNTYFGMLLKDVYDIRNQAKEVRKQKELELEAFKLSLKNNSTKGPSEDDPFGDLAL